MTVLLLPLVLLVHSVCAGNVLTEDLLLPKENLCVQPAPPNTKEIVPYTQTNPQKSTVPFAEMVFAENVRMTMGHISSPIVLQFQMNREDGYVPAVGKMR
jgi:hypothetical protein